MALISAIQISNFRSLRDLRLEDLASSNAIAGPNNSGKSNILRALNLFFNDEIEPGRLLDLSEDHYRPWGKKKKTISISVRFDLSHGFAYGKKYKNAEELLGYEPYIKRTWSYESRRTIAPQFFICNEEGLDSRSLTDSETSIVGSFLSLFKFRYIPNYVHPSTLISEEQSELQRNLLRRLRSVWKRKSKTGSGIEEIFTTLTELSGNITRPISQALTEASDEIESVELETSKGFDEVTFTFGYSMRIAGGDKLPATVQGSGVQAHLAYQMIHFLDTSFYLHFGNRQTVIWGVEEPESFLHTQLEYYLARFLLERATSESDRFQVFCTTHSDMIMRHASRGILVRLSKGVSTCKEMEPRDLVKQAPALGISRFVHALLDDNEPLVLVEGKIDKEVLEEAFSRTGREIPKIHCLETLDESDSTGGKDATLKYLKQNRAAANSRPIDSPITVVLDWETELPLVDKYKKVLQGHQSSRVLICDVALSNPDLDDSFAGIEKFYSTCVIEHAEEEGWLKLHRPFKGKYPLTVQKRSLKNGKKKVAEYLLAEGKQEDFDFLSKLADQIDTATGDAVSRP